MNKTVLVIVIVLVVIIGGYFLIRGGYQTPAPEAEPEPIPEPIPEEPEPVSGPAPGDGISTEEDALIPTDFAVSIGGPGVVDLEPGQIETYPYTIKNTGDNDDTYDLMSSASQTWADTSALPVIVSLASGQSVTFDVPVAIPPSTPIGTQDTLVLKVTSRSNPLLLDTVETTTTVVAAR